MALFDLSVLGGAEHEKILSQVSPRISRLPLHTFTGNGSKRCVSLLYMYMCTCLFALFVSSAEKWRHFISDTHTHTHPRRIFASQTKTILQMLQIKSNGAFLYANFIFVKYFGVFFKCTVVLCWDLARENIPLNY